MPLKRVDDTPNPKKKARRSPTAWIKKIKTDERCGFSANGTLRERGSSTVRLDALLERKAVPKVVPPQDLNAGSAP